MTYSMMTPFVLTPSGSCRLVSAARERSKKTSPRPRAARERRIRTRSKHIPANEITLS